MASALDVLVRFVGDATDAVKAATKTEDAYKDLGDKLTKTGLALSAAVTAPLTIIGVKALDRFKDMETTAARTNTVLESTGGVANVSAQQVDELAQSLLDKSGVDNEVIKSGENMLLTFTNVRNEAGKGNDIFNRATAAALDLSVAYGKDLTAAAKTVGKALDDPLTGMAGLNKMGIKLNETQKEQVQHFIDLGDVLSAQKIVLDAIAQKAGGAAAAYGDTLAGKAARAHTELQNLSATMVGLAAPALGFVADAAADAAKWVGELPEPVRAAFAAFAVAGATVGPVLTFLGQVSDAIPAVSKAFEVLKNNVATFGAVFAGLGLVGGLIGLGFALDALMPKNDAFAKALNESKDAGKAWADSHVAMVMATNTTQGAIDSLTATQRVLDAAMRDHFDLVHNSTAATFGMNDALEKQMVHYANLQGRSEGLDQAIATLNAKLLEEKAAAEAQAQALDASARASQGVATASDAARNATNQLATAFFAAQGGAVGYQAAQLQLQSAQYDLAKLQASGTATSYDLAVANNRVEQATLQVAQAAYQSESAQGALTSQLSGPGRAALITLRDSLAAAEAKHHDATGATQAQIDKINGLIAATGAVSPGKDGPNFNTNAPATQKQVEDLNRAADVAARSRQLAIDIMVTGGQGIVPGMQSGGIVPGARNSPQLILAHGGERVIPVGQSFSGGSSSTSNNFPTRFDITVNVPVGASASDTGRAIVDAIRQYERVGGKSWRN